MSNIFKPEVSQELVDRLSKLTPESKRVWGKMEVDQMLAHLNVAYDMTFTDDYPKPNFFVRWILKKWVKTQVVSDVQYPKNGKTTPQFIIKERRDFYEERDKLINYIWKVQKMGAVSFKGRESHSFGPLSSEEWSNMFYKHIDHHLRQFGV